MDQSQRFFDTKSELLNQIRYKAVTSTIKNCNTQQVLFLNQQVKCQNNYELQYSELNCDSGPNITDRSFVYVHIMPALFAVIPHNIHRFYSILMNIFTVQIICGLVRLPFINLQWIFNITWGTFKVLLWWCYFKSCISIFQEKSITTTCSLTPWKKVS